jgi:hypothetical protein
MSYNLPDVTFVVSKSGDPSIFERNFAASPCFEGIRPNRIIIQEGFASAAIAYNDAIEKAQTDLIVFSHQDVFFPADWLVDLNQSLKLLESSDPSWGVLGGWGVNNRGLQAGFLHSVGLGVLGAAFTQPVAIDTLDEFLLIMRKSSGLRFDPALPHFHFYGTDICLSARQKGKTCYAISAFCIHNTSYGYLAPEFFKSYWDIRRKWRALLPIQTPCIRVSRWNEDLITRKFKKVCFTLLGRDLRPRPRLDDPRSALPLTPALSQK